MFCARRQSRCVARILHRYSLALPSEIRNFRTTSMSTKINSPHSNSHDQAVPPDEVQQTKAGARGVRAGGNAGAMGDPVSDQSQHNYQVSRETDLAQHAEDAARSRFKSPNPKSSKP
jgi:hypothetical protein